MLNSQEETEPVSSSESHHNPEDIDPRPGEHGSNPVGLRSGYIHRVSPEQTEELEVDSTSTTLKILSWNDQGIRNKTNTSCKQQQPKTTST